MWRSRSRPKPVGRSSCRAVTFPAYGPTRHPMERGWGERPRRDLGFRIVKS